HLLFLMVHHLNTGVAPLKLAPTLRITLSETSNKRSLLLAEPRRVSGGSILGEVSRVPCSRNRNVTTWITQNPLEESLRPGSDSERLQWRQFSFRWDTTHQFPLCKWPHDNDT